MKQAAVPLPANAFLKILVGSKTRRVFFKDVKKYKKLMKPHLPPIPTFDTYVDWNKSTITSCEDDITKEDIMERTVITFQPWFIFLFSLYLFIINLPTIVIMIQKKGGLPKYETKLLIQQLRYIDNEINGKMPLLWLN